MQRGTQKWVQENKEVMVQGHKRILVPRKLWGRICASSSSRLDRALGE